MKFSRPLKPAKAILLAIEKHDAGSSSEAEVICRQILELDAKNFDALHLLGVIRSEARQHEDAIALFQQAIMQDSASAIARKYLGDAYRALDDIALARTCYQSAIDLNPDYAAAHSGLGVTYAIERQSSQAALSFRRAIDLAPDWAVPRFNLGLLLIEQADLQAAGRQFREAWLLDSETSSAFQCVDVVAKLVRSNAEYAGKLISQTPPPEILFSIIFCSIDDSKCAATIEMYERLFAGLQHEVIPIRDARSLAEAYNRGIASSQGDIVVFAHDDLEILAPDFAQRLHAHLCEFDVVGVVGATRLTGPTWGWAQYPFVRGWITHHAPNDESWFAAVIDPRPVADNIAVLDGVLIAARRAVLDEIAFDDKTFDGFHLYDIDWSYRASQAGFRLAAAGDLLVAHASRGAYDPNWQKYANDFCKKYRLEEVTPPPPAQLFEARFVNTNDVREFFSRLADIWA
jgi:tetratricopeptide (TPR) repeat protein